MAEGDQTSRRRTGPLVYSWIATAEPGCWRGRTRDWPLRASPGFLSSILPTMISWRRNAPAYPMRLLCSACLDYVLCLSVLRLHACLFSTSYVCFMACRSAAGCILPCNASLSDSASTCPILDPRQRVYAAYLAAL